MLVSVAGNPKVKRCTRCMTFVSARKAHSVAECNKRISKFRASKSRRRRKTRRRRR